MPCCTVSCQRRRQPAKDYHHDRYHPNRRGQGRELLEESGKADHALRIFVRGMSCSGPAYGMALDNEPRDDDSVAEFAACASWSTR